MQLKLPVTQYVEVEIPHKIKLQIAREEISKAMKFNNLYVRGGVVIETIKPDADPRSWSEREVRMATQEDLFVQNLLCTLLPC